MAKIPPEPPPVPPGDPTEQSPYELPPELRGTTTAHGPGDPMTLASEAFQLVERPGRSPAFKAAVAIAALAVIAGGLLWYRAHHRRRLVEVGIARAGQLLRLDTATGYREAASLLEPLAKLDPVEAGSVRAFALAMLFTDYREAAAEKEAEALLVAPERADRAPPMFHLASAALALGRRNAADVATAAGRAAGEAWSGVLLARTALLADNAEAALEPAATAAATDARLAAALALDGDLLRRIRKDPASAHTAYAAALAGSPFHPRAAFGLAKLALAGQAPMAEGVTALRRLLADPGTPSNERGRAALHLASLALRAGDRAAANTAFDTAGLDAPARAWAARAAAFAAEQTGAYRALEGAPESLLSASDDDPTVAAPPPAPPAAKVLVKAHQKAKRTAASKASATTSAKKAAATRAAKKKKKPTTTTTH